MREIGKEVVEAYQASNQSKHIPTPSHILDALGIAKFSLDFVTTQEAKAQPNERLVGCRAITPDGDDMINLTTLPAESLRGLTVLTAVMSTLTHLISQVFGNLSRHQAVPASQPCLESRNHIVAGCYNFSIALTGEQSRAALGRLISRNHKNRLDRQATFLIRRF